MLDAIRMTVDYINTERCGVSIQGKNYSLSLRTIGDNSHREMTHAIAQKIVQETDFLLPGYSSFLSEPLAAVADANGKVLVTAGSSYTSVHSGRPTVFGMVRY